jgi:hypothetical protein
MAENSRISKGVTEPVVPGQTHNPQILLREVLL